MNKTQRLTIALILVLVGCEELRAITPQTSSEATEQTQLPCRASHDDNAARRDDGGFKEPDLMRFTLQACVAALVNTQSVMRADAEIQRRAVKGN